MANDAVDLTTIDTLKARLGLSGVALSATDAGELARLITEASARMHTEIGGAVIYGARSDTKDGDGSYRLWLDDGVPPSSESLWFCSVASVVVDGVTVPESDTDGWTLVDKARLDLAGETYRFSAGRGNVVITYSAGFKTSPWGVPSDIEGAVCELAALKWRERDRIGQTSKSVSGETVSFQGSNVWSTFLAVAQAYHRVVV